MGAITDKLGAEFEAEVLRIRPMLVGLAHKILNDRDAAEDAVQRALLNAWRLLGEFRGEAKISSWLYGIVVNNCAMAKRHSKMRRAKSTDVKKHYYVRFELPDPEVCCFLHEVRQLVNAEIRRSPRLFRQTLITDLTIIQQEQNNPLKELAIQSGIGLGRAKTRRTRSRRWLRERMQSYRDSRAI